MPRKRPLLHRLIQHNYVGPGNAIDSAEAVDEPDVIAREHDIVYQAIQDSGVVDLESVNRADTDAAVEFFDSAVNSDSVSTALLSAASGVALTAKTAAEKYLFRAPVYPRMPIRSHKRKGTTENPLDQDPGKVRRVYGFHTANLNKAKAKLDQLSKKPGVTYEELADQQSKIDRLISDQNKYRSATAFHQEAADHRRLIDELDEVQPVLDTPPQSRAEGELGDDDLGGAGPGDGNTLPNQIQAPPVVTDEQRRRAEFLSDPFGLLPHDDEYENVLDRNIQEVLDYDAVNQNDIEMLISNEQFLSNLGLAEDMANVQQVMRSGGCRYEDGYIICEYQRLFYSWGYNWRALDITDNNASAATPVRQKWISTPLAYVPVDYVPFYLPPSVYNDLPNEAHVEEVMCKVTPWGSRVSFVTNAETTAPATAQHVVVGTSAIGLNVDPTFNFANRDVTESNTMQISTHTTMDLAKFRRKLWGANNASTMYDDVPATFGAIRQLDVYGGPVLDNYVASATGPPPSLTPVAEYQPTGWPDLETKINRFAFDAHKGKPIINYSYKPKFGILKFKSRRAQTNRSDVGSRAYSIIGLENNNVISCPEYRRSADANNNQTGTNATIDNNGDAARHISITSNRTLYDSMVDKPHCKFYSMDIGKEISPQPQLHIGILPVQANQPGASVGFVCAAAYWQIDSMMKIKVNFGSAFNQVIARPIEHMVSYYNDGVDDTNGIQGTIRGKLPSLTPYTS